MGETLSFAIMIEISIHPFHYCQTPQHKSFNKLDRTCRFQRNFENPLVRQIEKLLLLIVHAERLHEF